MIMSSMSEIAALGLQIDSGQVRTANSDLRQLVTIAGQAQKAMLANANASLTQADAARKAAQGVLQDTQATQQAVQRKRELEQSVQALNKSTQALSASRGRDSQLQEYAIRLNVTEQQNLKSLTAAQLTYNRALKEYGTVGAAARQSAGTGGALASTINSRLNVGTTTGLSKSDFDENTKYMSDMRASVDKVYASSKRYEAELLEIDTVTKKLNMTEAQNVALRERARVAFEAEAIASTNMTKNTKLSGAALTNLSYQINDVVSGLAMGQSPFQILTQQGGQFVQIMQMQGTGPMALLKGIGTVLGSILNPALLLGGALAIVGASVVGIYAAAISNEKKMEIALQGTGRAAGVTASQLNDIATASSKQANISIGNARAWAEAYAKSGAVAGDSIKQLTMITADYAATTGQSADDASKELAGSFTDLGSGIDTIAKKLGGISPAQRQYIKDLEASGQHNEAVRATLDAMQPSLVNYEKNLTAIGRAWNAIKNAASGALASGGDLSTSQQLENAKHALATANDNIDPNTGLSTSGSAARMQQQVDALTKQLAQEQAKAKTQAAQAAANRAANLATPFVEGATPGLSDRRQLTQQIGALDNQFNTPGAIAASGHTVSETAAALEAYTHALNSYLTPAQRATEQTKLDNQALVAKSPAQKAAVALAQTQLDQAGQVVTSEERKAAASAASSQAYAAAAYQLKIMNETQKIAVNGSVALAGAWLQGAGAAMHVQASTQAQTEALTQSINVKKRTMQLETEAAGNAVASAAQQADATDRQVAAQTAANDAVAAGTISITQAATYAQRYGDMQELEIIRTMDVVKANKALADALDQVISRRKVANDNDDTQHDRTLFAQTKQDLQDQIKLAGMSADERERESAVLDLIRQSNGKITQEEQDQVRGWVAVRQETERMRAVVDEVSGGFQDMFTDLLSTGKLSIGKLADTIKMSFVKLLAWMATQAIMQPIIVPMVGEIAGAFGLGSGGGISAGGGLGGSSSLGLLSGASDISSLFGGGGVSSIFGGGVGSTSASLFGAGGLGGALGFGFDVAPTAGALTELGGGLGSISSGLPGFSASGSLFSGTLGGALGGFGLGSLASSLIFGNKNDAGIGGMSGAAAGALLGSIVPGIGTIIGGLAGGLLGGGIGSLTGSSNQGAIANFNTDGSNYLFKQGGGDNGALATNAANEVTQVIKGLASAGVTVSLGNVSGLSIGSDKSYVYGYDGMKEKLAGGADGVAAVVSSILGKILPSATGGDANTQKVLAKYQQSGGINADNLDQLVSDLGFAKSIANFDFGVKALTQSQQLLKSIGDQFQGAIEKAQELGLDTTSLINAKNQAIAQVVSDYNDNISQSLEQITDPIKYAFDQLAIAQKQRIEDATGLGADLTQVYALNKAEQDALIKQTRENSQAAIDQAQAVSAAQAELNKAYSKALQPLQDTISKYDQLSKSLRQFGDSIFTSDLGGGSVQQQYTEARAQFDSVSKQAMGGDADAMSQLQGVSQNFLQLSQATSQNQVQYARDVAIVKTAVDKSADYAQLQVTSAQQQIDLMNEQVKGLGVIDEDVKTVAQAIAELAAAQAGAASIAQGSQSDGSTGSSSLDATIADATAQFNDLNAGAATATTGSTPAYTTYQSAVEAMNSALAGGAAYLDSQGIYHSVGMQPNVGAGQPGYWNVGTMSADQASAFGDYQNQFMSAFQSAQAAYQPGFARGGHHRGGWRVVGEEGPELENTGPSDIHSTDAINQLFDSAGIVNELRGLRTTVEAIASQSKDGGTYLKRMLDIFNAITAKNGGSSVTTNT